VTPAANCPEFWQRVNRLPLAALVIETAFSNREGTLARLAQHLAPHALAEELAQLAPGQRCPIYITHTKPLETDLIMQEIRQFRSRAPPMVLQRRMTFGGCRRGMCCRFDILG
jgi:hypothetical protein